MDQQQYPVTEQIFVRTPLMESVALRQHAAGRRVFLKLENTQPSGSFKLRGISALCKYVSHVILHSFLQLFFATF